MLHHRLFYLFMPFVVVCSAFGQDKQQRLAILPFQPVGVEEVTAQSAESLLRLEISRLGSMDLISEKTIIDAMDIEYCNDMNCALAVGEKLNADLVVTGQLLALGEKVIVQYILVDVAAKKELLIDKLTASVVEDLDNVMKRVAKSIVKNVPVKKTAEVGDIVQDEAKKPLRRGAFQYAGISFGYLYPQKGYDEVERSFTGDLRLVAEFDHYDVGMQLALRKGFAMNVYTSYLTTTNDICPYIGGALGFHWVAHSYGYDTYYENGYYREEEKKGDGIELTLNSGIKLFRTYSFQIIVNLAYCVTFNDYDDRAVVFTLGFLP
ncbi:hypothetical protein A2V82_12305 [candidate division KSB1 bacterium RBG_16_48_16]|nr:MAG: hypothetical protein A2V82_12305 [candidate division KSB1 bacterium RBG_16_48_16]